jgi:hypothetical protein
MTRLPKRRTTACKNNMSRLFRAAGIPATVAVVLVATVVTAMPAVAGASKIPAEVTLSSSVPSELVTGQAVTFTATVTATPGPATGDIVFLVVGSDGIVVNCDGGNTQPLVTADEMTTAMCSFAQGLSGSIRSYKLSAKLVDPQFKAPTARLVQKVSKAMTDTTTLDLPGSVIASQAFSFTATVQTAAPGTGSPTGSMDFAVCPRNQSRTCTGLPGGISALPSPTPPEQALNENQITFSLPSGVLKPGSYRVTSHYLGDSNYQSSDSPDVSLKVDKASTMLSLVPSRNPAKNGGREILRGLITVDPLATPSLAAPTGTVKFTVTGASGKTVNCKGGSSAIPVGTKSSNQGVARCDVSGSLRASDSPYTVKAVYSGDSVHLKSKTTGSVSVNPPA